MMDYSPRPIEATLGTSGAPRFERIMGELGVAGRGAIVAGHYCVAPHMAELGADCLAEQRTFALGLEHWRAAEALGHDVVLVLWVNDIGITPVQRAALKEHYVLPDPYRELMAANDRDPAKLLVLFESTMRNRASASFRLARRQDRLRRVPSDRPSLVRCVEDSVCERDASAAEALVVAGPGGEELVLKDGSHPKCCAIIATLFEVLHRRHGADYIINIFNDLYIARLRYGIHVARVVFENDIPIASIFGDDTTFLDPQIEKTKVEQ